MCTILVLEDDKALNQNISDALIQQNYTVISCHTGTKAKDILQKKKTNLIILDINLPDENGFQFCTWLKSKYMIPVIFVSGRNLEDDILNGYDLGADDYITKPFSVKILLKKINVILTRHSHSLWDNGLQITDKHTLAVNINRLRKKIENDKHSYISNVYGLGYLWKSSF